MVIPFKDTPSLAPTMLSFGFRNGDQVSVSVEARLEKDEKYSPVLEPYGNMRLMYVLAMKRRHFASLEIRDSRRVSLPHQSHRNSRGACSSMFWTGFNKIYREPEFYDALTNNCTNNIVGTTSIGSRRPDPPWGPARSASRVCGSIRLRSGVTRYLEAL